MVSATVMRTNMIYYMYWWLGESNESTFRGLGPNQKGCYRDLISRNKEVQCQVRESWWNFRLISSTTCVFGPRCLSVVCGDGSDGRSGAERMMRWEKAEADDGRT